MTVVSATVRGGRVELDHPIDLPEGTKVVVQLRDPSHSDYGISEEDWDDSPEAIDRWIQWYDSFEPLIFTPEELAAWEADRKARKEWELANFEQHADQLRKLWE